MSKIHGRDHRPGAEGPGDGHICLQSHRLPLVPGLVLIGGEGGVPTLLEVTAESGTPGPLIFLAVCWQALWRVWREPYSVMLRCSCCSPVSAPP